MEWDRKKKGERISVSVYSMGKKREERSPARNIQNASLFSNFWHR